MTMNSGKDVVIIDGARTPFGTFCGSLRDVPEIELGAVAAKAALERSKVDPSLVDNVMMGNVIQSSSNAPYTARHVGLKVGVPIPTPALTVNRLCGSGMQAVVSAAQAIILGESEVALAGGTENMSQVPFVVRGARWGIPLDGGKLEDYLWAGLTDGYTGVGMAITAENLAEKYDISRQAQDEFAYRSQMTVRAAREKGYLAEEIVPVEIKTRKGTVVVERDEHPRPDTTLEALAKLPARFKQNGTVTAGTSSGINDGAAAMVVTSAEVARLMGLKPLGRVLSWGISGVDPAIMGIGPAFAIPQALDRAGMTLDDMDLIEVNEAFAAQYIAVERELGLDRERVNVNGGAIALGHPVGASGARLLLTLLYELRRRGKRLGVASLCCGGGQGIAAVVECLQA